MSGNIIGGASEVVALDVSQIHRATALVGVRAELKKDEEMLDMLKNHWKFIKSSELLTLLHLCIFLILMIFKL